MPVDMLYPYQFGGCFGLPEQPQLPLAKAPRPVPPSKQARAGSPQLRIPGLQPAFRRDFPVQPSRGARRTDASIVHISIYICIISIYI